MRRITSSRVALTRGLAALMATIVVFTLRPAMGSPADIFSMPAPATSGEVPKASSLKTGDASVSTQTGAMTYSYPVAVPPGRNGMAPQLSLNYSSHAPIYGGIAAGWSLDVPTISEDHSYGRLRTRSPEVETYQQQQQGLDQRADDRFVSSLAGGRPLVLTGEAVDTGVYGMYRAQNDTSYARYERMNAVQQGYHWRVRRTDGTVMRFGEAARMTGCTAVSEQNAPLTTMTDPFGNEVQFAYAQAGLFPGECRLNNISWGYNASAGITQPFASVVFGWGESPTCASGVHTGSFRDYRTGNLVVTGASKLTTITSTAFPIGQPGVPEHTRVITLGYDAQTEQCNRHHASYRSLTSIQESAWIGNNTQRVDLAPVTFSYAGVPMLTTQANPPTGTPWIGDFSGGGVDGRNTLSWGYRRPTDDRWPTVEAMTIDVNGDGLIDRLMNESSNPDLTINECKANWQRNNGPDVSGNVTFTTMPTQISLPRLKWRGASTQANGSSAGGASAFRDSQNYEYCSLNGQVTTFQNSDGQPGCHMPGTCALGTNGTGKPYCTGGGTECHPGAGQSGGFYRTYLAYRWIDMDNDALPDLVAAVHGNISVYDIERGNLGGGYSLGEPSMSGIPAMNAWPACPSQQIDRCKEVGRDLDGERTCSGALCTWNWANINTILSGAASADCFDFLARPTGTGTTAATPHRAPYTRCEGLYPWFIYWNRGNGAFETTPTVKYQPIPLESETGDSSLYGPAVISKDHAVHDVDGDGFVDGLVHGESTPNGNPHGWYVWLGDGEGGFLPRRYFFPTRSNGSTNDDYSANAFAGYTGLGGTFSENSRGLVDLNGDGLTDQWIAVPNSLHANVTLNDGTQQRSFSTAPLLAGEIDTPPSVRPGHDMVHDVNANDFTGTATAKLRTVDLDEDGRVDVVKLAPSPVVYWNGGGQFASASNPYPHTLAAGTDGLRRNTAALNTLASAQTSDPYWWRLESDLIDIDGNGIVDNLYYQAGVLKRVRENNTAPPRTMTVINNGRGATTTIGYASMHENFSATPTVTQDATQFAMDPWCLGASVTGCPKASPRAMWVVKSVTTADSFALTDTTTSYRYWYPRWAPDDAKRYGFRGFEEVQTTSQSGAKTIQTYGYGVDWSGRLIKTIVQSFEFPNKAHSISKTDWQPRTLTLSSNVVTTYHATLSESFTCPPNKTEIECTAAPAAYTRTSPTLTALASTTTPGVPLLWQETESWLRSGSADANGDRRNTVTFALHANATTYRLRPLVVTKESRVAGAMVVYAKSAQTWDGEYKVPLTSEVWVDNVAANRSIARAEFDMTTGNMLRRWKPVQNAAGGPSTDFVYDARKLFIETETNEMGVGHLRTFKWDYGTGTKLMTDGPNVRGCFTNPTTCPEDDTHPLKEQNKIRIDGMGRIIERWESFSGDGLFYTLYLVETNSYTAATTTAPESVFHQSLLDIEGTTWMQDKTEVDGHGRPIRHTVFVQLTAPANQVTSYIYRGDGTLQSVSVPDPTPVNNATLVTYTYSFDSLGRPTSIRRPDTVVQSGVNLTYGQAGAIGAACPNHPAGNGIMQTAEEIVGSAGGQPGATRTTTDSLGRLIRVEEKTVSPSTWVGTTYCYGPDGSVATIVDPQSVTTVLEHDLAGRRTKITRTGNRQWQYTYDANGNMRTEQVPGSGGGLDNINFITSTAYDVLDRPLSKEIGQRHLLPADQTAFGTMRENFYYDMDTNMAGRLRYWYSYDPAGNWTVGKDFRTDIQGRPAGTTHHLRIPGFPELAREIYQSWYAFGPQQQQRTGDVMGPASDTTWSVYRYDARGLPLQAEIWNLGTGGTTITPVGVQTRNVAGLVTRRRSTVAAPTTHVESTWMYDKLGRVIDQTVQKASSTTPIVRQELTYFGNDDVKTLRHHLGATNRLFTHTFDLRHQLTNVTTSTSGYFTGTYQYTGASGSAGRMTRATHLRTLSPPPLDPKLVRNVNYVYGGTDPEQVTALTNVTGGGTYASYTYDAVGNQLTRSYPSSNELWEYVYDGKDQLRRATRKLSGVVTGSEEYWYDEAGQRMAVVKKNNLGVNTELIWFIGDTQAHYTGTGNLTKIYSHVSMGTPIARVERTGDTTTTTEFQFHGLASNTIAAVATNGTINASFTYAPFGEVIEATNAGGLSAGTAAHKRRLNDKYEDDLTGLAYYGARYFDKTLIGWSQADPLYIRVPDAAQLSSPRRANIYTFSLNNSLRYIDPDGLDAKGPAPGLDSYRSEMETSAAGRAANMASDNWTQGCEAYWGGDWCIGGGGGGGSRNSLFDPSDPCNNVTSVCQEDGDIAAKDAAVDDDGNSTATDLMQCNDESDCRAARTMRSAWVIPNVVIHFKSIGDRLLNAANGGADNPRLHYDMFMLFAPGGLGPSGPGLASGPFVGGHGIAITFTRTMSSSKRIIASGGEIRKIEDLVSKFGGTHKGWTKYSTVDSLNREVHWYQHAGIGKRGVKFAGTDDPF